MTTAVEIEGSEARARDRGADQLGYTTPSPRQFDLADPEQVGAQYDAFRGSLIDIHTRALGSKNYNAPGAVTALCDRYAGMFLGLDPAVKCPPWNSQGELGQAMLARYGSAEGETPELAMDAFWHAQAAGLYAIMDAGGDEQASRLALDAQREDALAQLLGAPAQPAL